MKTLPVPRVSLVHRPESDNVLIIRRGPTNRVAFFGWNRKTNVVEIGQWLNGHIFPKRCDLSPNGKYVIYFASNYQKANTESKATWTVVSRFPYLKALDFWPKGDSWNGGGLFESNSSYLLHEYGEHHELHTISNKFRVFRGVPDSPIKNNECLGVYIPKLVRDEWVLKNQDTDSLGKIYNFTKRINSKLVINKTLHATSSPPEGKDCYFEEHFIKGVREGRKNFKDIQYLDYYKGKLFWAENGKLFTSKIIGSAIELPELVHDFSKYEYQRIKAPY